MPKQTRCFRMFGFVAGGGYGGASRDRTDDPLLAKQVLSQLSYGPSACSFCCVAFSLSRSCIYRYTHSFFQKAPRLKQKLLRPNFKVISF